MNKDKTSRSFIPIAEEYIKSGMLDEAIAVLKDGLQAYPNYTGARVSLGKAYLEKGMVHEAMEEFEQVVQVSPDNLLAHRKLVSIYKDLGRIDDAIRACETLLVFSPKDKEISDLLSNLMTEKIEKVSQEPPPSVGYTGTVEMRYAEPVSREGGENIDFTSTWEVEAKREKDDEKTVVPEFVTETMGDLYIAQGDIEKGTDVYRRILEREPENESVKGKLDLAKHPMSGMGAPNLHDLYPEQEGGTQEEMQIKRLQDFLERIRKNKR